MLDPVGAGATRLRTETAKRILEEVEIAVVRGNPAEVATLAGRQAETAGVESIGASDSGGGARKGCCLNAQVCRCRHRARRLRLGRERVWIAVNKRR